MEHVRPLVSFNLRNANRDKLTLQYGRVLCANGNASSLVEDQRWRFYGKKIPMPVRSGTWFQGLSTTEMLDWLKKEGWYPETHVNIGTGTAFVYDGKGNDGLADAIRYLCTNNRVQAIRVYKYIANCSIRDAVDAVNKISPV